MRPVSLDNSLLNFDSSVIAGIVRLGFVIKTFTGKAFNMRCKDIRLTQGYQYTSIHLTV